MFLGTQTLEIYTLLSPYHSNNTFATKFILSDTNLALSVFN